MENSITDVLNEMKKINEYIEKIANRLNSLENTVEELKQASASLEIRTDEKFEIIQKEFNCHEYELRLSNLKLAHQQRQIRKLAFGKIII